MVTGIGPLAVGAATLHQRGVLLGRVGLVQLQRAVFAPQQDPTDSEEVDRAALVGERTTSPLDDLLVVGVPDLIAGAGRDHHPRREVVSEQVVQLLGDGEAAGAVRADGLRTGRDGRVGPAPGGGKFPEVVVVGGEGKDVS